MKLPPVLGASPTVTILGLGSLLSERSSKTTFPDLQNFRLGRVSQKYRRIFDHPTSLFFQRGLANLETKEFSSLTGEEFVPDPDATYPGGFVCSIFEVPRDQVYVDEKAADGTIVTKPTGDFLEREEEYNIIEVPYVDFSDDGDDDTAEGEEGAYEKRGVLCTRFSDDGFVERWGQARFDKNYGDYGLPTIWGWGPDSGLRPCRVYLRHCYLAARSMGRESFDSFLDETFLIDRTTTIRDYIDRNPGLIETSLPPPEHRQRYGG